MKNQFLLTCFFCLMFQVLGFSQSDFAAVGMKWTYTQYVSGPNPSIGTKYPFYMIADTELMYQGRLCRRLIAGRAGQPMVPYFYVYNQQDSVFFWNTNSNRFNLLYDFSAEAGDSWEIDMPPGFSEFNDSSAFVRVDSVSRMVFGGDSLRVWHITYHEWTDWSDIYIERIGSTCFFIPIPDVEEPSVCDLRCFEIDTFQVIFSPFPCDTLLVTGSSGALEKQPPVPVRVYPNPASENLMIECAELPGEPLMIQWSDLSGRIIRTESFSNTGNYNMDIRDIPNGMYLLRVMSSERRWYTFKIVVVK